MTDSEGPDPQDSPADPPHPGAEDQAASEQDVTPAFDIDLEPDEQGTAGAGAEPSG